MLERITTFVIGAGASRDLGFPLGDSLRDRIINTLDVDDPNHSINFKDPSLSRILQDRAIKEVGEQQWVTQLEFYRDAATIIRNGLPFARSIDTFIDGLKGNDQIGFLGKLAITLAILRAEADSPLGSKTGSYSASREFRERNLKHLLGSWHVELSQILFDGHTVATLDSVFENASFIVFNYDRCLEEFLTISLMRRFSIERARALALVGKCSIIHPYGQVGAFQSDEGGYLAFGQFQDHQVAAAASRIRTFTESMESEVAAGIKSLVAQAEVIAFMGFGWLPQNMELLQVEEGNTNARWVYATMMNMEQGEIDVVIRQINQILKRDEDYYQTYDDSPVEELEFIIDRGDCKALMQNCWLRLTS